MDFGGHYPTCCTCTQRIHRWVCTFLVVSDPDTWGPLSATHPLSWGRLPEFYLPGIQVRRALLSILLATLSCPTGFSPQFPVLRQRTATILKSRG